MPDVECAPPFDAYMGGDPYIFVSYAHKDGAAVFPELLELHKGGFRIWYDEGIDPGNEWPDEVAKALTDSAYFVVFLSPHSLASSNVRNEIHFALNNHKPLLAVHLAKASLPAGLALRMGDIQAILKYQMSPDSYRRKLRKVLPSSLRSAGPLYDALVSRLAAAQHLDAFAVGNALVYFSPAGKYCNVRLDEVNRVIGDDFESRLPDAWEITSHGTELCRRWEMARTPEQAQQIAHEILAVHQLVYPQKLLARLNLVGARNPCSGGRWFETMSNGMDVDCTCKACGWSTYFTPALDERPPSSCALCGAS